MLAELDYDNIRHFVRASETAQPILGRRARGRQADF